MKRFSSFTIQAIVCCTLLGAIITLPGCGTDHPAIPENISELSLSELWDGLADAAGIENADAELESFRLYSDGTGKIETLALTFDATVNNGKAIRYYVNMKSDRLLDWYTEDGELSSGDRHPRKVFSEIDSIGLDTITFDENGLSIDIEYVSGDIGFHREYLDIYSIENGTLRPIEAIIFHNKLPWCVISVYNLIPNGTATEPTTTEGTVPEEERTTQKWILSDDLMKAETVTYVSN